ncbi:hypothetical protein [Nisaea sp.]|uniref:hypothetical protein n=1 Tax=Nisaea sp. TaxID=2024842 RepID=UPI003B521446
MASYVFTLPFALGDKDAEILLARRQLIQTRSGGRTIRGRIPEWAGQWGLIGDAQGKGESAEATGIRAFREQAGLDLSDRDVQSNFMLHNRSLVSAETAEYTPFNVLCIFTTRGALQLAQSVVSDALGTEQVTEATLAEVEIRTVTSARNMLGPRRPPPKGWKSFLVQNYFGGTEPGAFNTEIDELTRLIATRAAQDNSFFAAALDGKAPR